MTTKSKLYLLSFGSSVKFVIEDNPYNCSLCKSHLIKETQTNEWTFYPYSLTDSPDVHYYTTSVGLTHIVALSLTTY